MRKIQVVKFLGCLALMAIASSRLALASADAPEDIPALFQTHCAVCHDHPETKAPPVDSLRKKIIYNFLVNICGCSQNWTPASFAQETIEKLKKQIGDAQVIMALSGGVDSTVAATLISKAIGSRLHGRILIALSGSPKRLTDSGRAFSR